MKIEKIEVGRSWGLYPVGGHIDMNIFPCLVVGNTEVCPSTLGTFCIKVLVEQWNRWERYSAHLKWKQLFDTQSHHMFGVYCSFPQSVRSFCRRYNLEYNGVVTIDLPMRSSSSQLQLLAHQIWYTVMRHLTTGIPSEKCVIRRFRRCANVIECTYTNLDSIAYYTPRLYGIAYSS